MPRSLRYLLIWLSCTAVAIAAVSLTVRFVVNSTTPLPPTAHARPATFDEPGPAAVSAAPPVPSPRPSRSATPAPSTPPRPRPSTPTAAPHTRPPVTANPVDPAACQGGAGAHTVQSQGGQVTVDWGADALCLVSAVPARGFTTRTQQPSADRLTVTFSGSHHRSQITATLRPQAKAVTSESSW